MFLIGTSHSFLTGEMQFHHISLGLVYLHSRKIVHGDLKAVNMSHLLVISTVFDLTFLAECVN
jgi:hypothetical protein